MKEKKSPLGIADTLLPFLSIIFLVGLMTFAGACGPKEDGSFMTCHWAGQAVKALAVLLLITSIVRLAIRDRGTKKGLSIAIVLTAITAAVVPGILINLCMMNTMHCHAVMRPFIIVMAVLLAATAIFDIIRP
ncbi:MAG: DUF4418 family protein [Blautia sp.]|nr:DUF4418 family protein [Blautia sp.]